jgi:hypothetical protein
MKYLSLVQYFEHAILDLLKSKEETTVSLMRTADSASAFSVVSVNLYREETPWLQLCLGTNSDRQRFLNTTADWKYFNLANTMETKSNAIDQAISAITEYTMPPDKADTDEWEPTNAAYIHSRQVILYLATAQALLSPAVWRYFNQLQRDVYLAAKQSLEQHQKSDYYVKNPKALDYLIEKVTSDEPTLHCTVTSEDLSAEANYCEMIKILRQIEDNIGEVTSGIFRQIE